MFLGTRTLQLLVDDVEYSAEISNCRITGGAAQAGFVSFAVAKAGGKREYRLQGTVVQNPTEKAYNANALTNPSLHDLMWTKPGQVVYANVLPSGDLGSGNLAYSGNIVIAEPDGDLVGGEANADPLAVFTWEMNWVFTERPIVSEV